jgi:hypothetical protein
MRIMPTIMHASRLLDGERRAAANLFGGGAQPLLPAAVSRPEIGRLPGG